MVLPLHLGKHQPSLHTLKNEQQGFKCKCKLLRVPLLTDNAFCTKLSFHVPFSGSHASPALKARPYRPRPSLPRTRPERPHRTPGRSPRPPPQRGSPSPQGTAGGGGGGVVHRGLTVNAGTESTPPPTAFAAPRAQPPQASPEQRRARHVPSPPAGKNGGREGGRCRFPPLRGQRCRPRSGAGPSPARPPQPSAPAGLSPGLAAGRGRHRRREKEGACACRGARGPLAPASHPAAHGREEGESG